MYELPDDDPIFQQRTGAPAELTLGSVGRLGAAVGDLQAFAKRADDLLAKLGELNDRIAAIEAEQPPRPRIYREAAK